MKNRENICKLIDDLGRIARQATPGKWWIDSHGHAMVAFSTEDAVMETVFVTDGNMGPVVRHENTGNLSAWRNDMDATYIATACPQNVLAVLEYLSSGANAWNTISTYMETCLHGDAAALRNDVSRKLFDDGCHSAAVHAIQFIEALIDQNIELKAELESK